VSAGIADGRYCNRRTLESRSINSLLPGLVLRNEPARFTGGSDHGAQMREIVAAKEPDEPRSGQHNLPTPGFTSGGCASRHARRKLASGELIVKEGMCTRE
jgi:hypothetical protein